MAYEQGQHACRCKACHPGYGFLSENVDFVEALEGKGVAFLGPTADTMRMFARKHTAREFAESADVPVLPGAQLLCPGKPAHTLKRCCHILPLNVRHQPISSVKSMLVPLLPSAVSLSLPAAVRLCCQVASSLACRGSV